MPIIQIIDQPLPGSLNVAYRPIIITTHAQATADSLVAPPVVYCDVYFAGEYYKTYSKTQHASYKKLNSTTNQFIYEFDIQDVCQEYLKYKIETYGTADMIEASNVIVNCFCKLRSSGYNTAGFLEPEGVEPVQKTNDAEAIAGDGYQTETFTVVSATLQHTDNQDLATHLKYYKTGNWAEDVFPLTHRSLGIYKVCPDMSDFFPLLLTGDKFIRCFRLKYRMTGESNYRTDQYCFPIPCEKVILTDINESDNGDGTQTITISFDPLISEVQLLDVYYRPQGGGEEEWVITTVPAVSPQFFSPIPLGKYEFKIKSKGDCTPVDSDSYIVGIPPECVPATFNSPIALPDGAVGQQYYFEVELSGTAPYTILFPVKPSWLNVSISGNKLVFSGTPTLGFANTTNGVYVPIVNCSVLGTLIFNQNVHVTAAPSGGNTINVTIQPGTSFEVQNPYDNCYRWDGRISIIKITGYVTVATQVFSGHNPANVLQIETLTAANLDDGNYLIDWDVQIYQGCSASDTRVKTIFNGVTINKDKIDNRMLTVNGGNIYNTTLELQNL